MKYGVREVANVVFRAKASTKIGNTTFDDKQPVLYLDSAKTTALEGNAEITYAKGGRGNTNLLSWEGDKTLSFTVEDALISPIGMSILSGAGLIKKSASDLVRVHMTSKAVCTITASGSSKVGTITLSNVLADGETICEETPSASTKTYKKDMIFVIPVEKDGSLKTDRFEVTDVTENDKSVTLTVKADKFEEGTITVFVDYYIRKPGNNVSEIQIDAAHFAGFYYVEADTLFRRQTDGVDAAVNITIPNVKIKSNFNFSLSASGDPSTFSFAMDAFPGYTYFNNTKEVLCVMQIVEDASGAASDAWDTVMA